MSTTAPAPTAVAAPAVASGRLGAWWANGAASLEAPVAFDAALVGAWLIGQVSDVQALSTAAIGIAALAALQWPATAAVLACLVLLFPNDGHVAGGLVLVLAAGLGELVWCARAGWRLRPDLLVLAAGTLLATTGLALFATLGSADSADAVRSSFRWIGFASGLLVLPIQLMLVGHGSRRSSFALLGAVSAALALAVIEQVAPAQIAATPLQHLLTTVDAARATGPFDSPNRLGTVAGMTLVIAIAGFGIARSRPSVAALTCLAALATVALLLSFSRGAILGVAVALVILAALRSPRVGIAAVAVVVALALVATPIVISARLGGSEAREARLAADDAQRIAAWRAGLQMFAVAPLTGEGYGSFAWAAVDPDVGPLETAHNELIALLAEAGLFAGGAYVAIVVLIAARGLRPQPQARIALGAATVFVVATMFNVQSVYPEVTVVLWTAVAFGLGSAGAPAHLERGKP